MAEAVNGNVEIMETMLIINQLTGLQGKVVGNIQVINPDTANGMQLSNEQAYYCFRELNKHDAVEVNKFETGEIKLASKYELAANMLKDIMTSGENHEWKDEFANFRNFSSAKSLLDQYIDSDCLGSVINPPDFSVRRKYCDGSFCRLNAGSSQTYGRHIC